MKMTFGVFGYLFVIAQIDLNKILRFVCNNLFGNLIQEYGFRGLW